MREREREREREGERERERERERESEMSKWVAAHYGLSGAPLMGSHTRTADDMTTGKESHGSTVRE